MPILKLGTGTLLYTPPYFSNSLSLSNYCFLRKMWHHSRTTLAPSHQCYSAITTTTICECAASLCTKNATQKLFSSKSIFFFVFSTFFFFCKNGENSTSLPSEKKGSQSQEMHANAAQLWSILSIYNSPTSTSQHCLTFTEIQDNIIDIKIYI